MLLLLVSCGRSKKSLNTEESMSALEFVESFPEMTLPYTLADSAVRKMPKDSLLINSKLVRSFIPDSIYRKEFKSGTPRVHALGRAVDKNGDNYLVVRAATPARQAGYILVYDKDGGFRAGMPLVTSNTERGVDLEGTLDRRYAIIRNRRRTSKDGQVYYTRNAYVYNNVGTFTLILTESNEVPEEENVYNPIDTFPQTHKWTGNYVKDKKNFVTIRDGAKPGRLLFFVHFEKNDGECIGELKGELDLVQPALAHYSAPGDPCSLEFRFENNRVTLAELSGCGNYRGIRCFFNDSYPKRAVKPRKKPEARKK
jgi:hypothetical protein